MTAPVPTNTTKTDPEIKSLAAAIAGETLEPSIDLDSLGKNPDPADSGKTPDASGGTAVEAPSGQASTGDKGDDDAGSKLENEEPIKLSDLDLDALLKHPKLGPTLNSWADRAAASQVQAALSQAQPGIEANTRQQLEDQAFDREVKEMTEQELAEELRDPAFQKRYARWVDQSQTPTSLDPNAVAEVSQVFAYAAQIATYNRALANSGISQEVKDTLKSENYTAQGPDGLIKWGEDVMIALSNHAAEARASELLEERWEAFRQDRLAEQDGSRPPLTPGRKAPPQLDLLGTPSDTLLEKALSK